MATMLPVLQTERLTVRPWTEDAPDLRRVLDTYSRWEVSRWLGAQPRVIADLVEARTMVRRWSSYGADDHRFGAWAIEVSETGQVAGTVLFKLLPNSDGSPATDVEVGWHLHPDAQGQGYATEAARGAVERGFRLGVPEVFAVVHPGNAASLAVCARLGMAPLGRTARWYGVEVEAFRLAPGGTDRSGPPAADPQDRSGTMAG